MYGIYAVRSSTINAEYANAIGAGTHGVYAAYASTINAYGANAQRGGSPGASDFVVTDGSHINAASATGGFSQTKNTLTRNGVIYDD